MSRLYCTFPTFIEKSKNKSNHATTLLKIPPDAPLPAAEHPQSFAWCTRPLPTCPAHLATPPILHVQLLQCTILDFASGPFPSIQLSAWSNFIHVVKFCLSYNAWLNCHVLHGNVPLSPTYFQVTLAHFSLYLHCSSFMTVSKMINYMYFYILDSYYLIVRSSW